MKESIKHAAVKDVKGIIVIAKSHGDCFIKGRCIGLNMSPKAKDQGFFTSKGRFVSREVAAKIAKKAKQIDARRKCPILISEDIWYRDEFVYCPVRGYLKVKGEK
jgi:hypothetical protein